LKKKALSLVLTVIFTASLFTGFAFKGVSKDSLVVAIQLSPTSMDPAKLVNSSDGTTFHTIYDTLIDITPSLKPKAKVALSWSTSKDGRTTTFKIRKGIKFHNGDDLTAEDVAFSINRYLKEPGAGAYYYALFIKNAVVVDQYTVNLITFNKYDVLLNNLATNFFIVPKKYVEKTGKDFENKPVGSGPYKFVSWSKGSSAEMIRNDKYFDGKSTIKNLKIKFIADPGTQAIALETGEVNVIYNAANANRKDIMSDKKIEYKEGPGGYIFQMSMYQSGALKDYRLRKAMQLSINKKDIINMALDGVGKPANSNVSEEVYKEYAGSNNVKYDPAQAKQILTQAKYSPEKSPITITTLDPLSAKVAQVVQAQLSQVGIKVNVQTIEYSSYTQQSRAGKIQILLTQGGGTAVGPTDTVYNYTRKADSQGRFPRSIEIDGIYNSLLKETDQKRAATLTKNAFSVITKNYVYMPICASYFNVAYAKGLKNVAFSPISIHYIGDYTW
jgi:peptide/nickel transport system substrate-binding protein